MELKPCPFCGGEAVSMEPFDGVFSAMCQGCKCGGPITRQEELSIEAWNRRAVISLGLPFKR